MKNDITMRHVFIFGIIISIGCSTGNGRNNNISIKPDTIPQFANITVDKETPNSVFFKLLDSANKYKKNDPIPDFFYNYRLDYEHPWLTDHFSYSLRKLLIDSTSNKELLRAILKPGDSRLKKIVDSGEVSETDLLNALPYRNLSIYDMAKMRLGK